MDENIDEFLVPDFHFDDVPGADKRIVPGLHGLTPFWWVPDWTALVMFSSGLIKTIARVLEMVIQVTAKRVISQTPGSESIRHHRPGFPYGHPGPGDVDVIIVFLYSSIQVLCLTTIKMSGSFTS
jgi:hypothetical protein